MVDALSSLLLTGTTLAAPLAMLALVLWPLLAALLEISKAIRGPITESRSFILTSDGGTIWRTRSRSPASESLGDERLRLSVLIACGVEAAFIVFFAVFLFQHANPRGDGMEMAAVGFAFMIIFLPLTLPAFILAKNRRWLVLAAGLAGLAAVAYFGLWLEMLSELG